MLTLRVEWTRRGRDEHSIHECTEYQVQYIGGRTVVTLEQGSDAPHELIIDGNMVVYAMNEHGKTVDVIRPRRKKKDAPIQAEAG